jgi:hypothetical protein
VDGGGFYKLTVEHPEKHCLCILLIGPLRVLDHGVDAEHGFVDTHGRVFASSVDLARSDGFNQSHSHDCSPILVQLVERVHVLVVGLARLPRFRVTLDPDGRPDADCGQGREHDRNSDVGLDPSFEHHPRQEYGAVHAGVPIIIIIIIIVGHPHRIVVVIVFHQEILELDISMEDFSLM